MSGTRLGLRLGELLIRAACHRLPADVRAERCREWTAELPAILGDESIRPSFLRAAQALAFCAGISRTTRQLSRAWRAGSVRTRKSQWRTGGIPVRLRNEAAMTEEHEVRRGYEQFVSPQAPPGMYFDPASELLLPQGVRLASRAQVASAWFLGLLLFSVTLGIGYIAWSLFAWGQGRTPAQRILSLRCWLPEARQVAGREQTAQRQITGFFLNGQLLAGFVILLTNKKLRSVGDFFASTVLLYDPDEVLRPSSAAPAP